LRDIDEIIRQLQLAHPDICAEQLAVGHPGADDDGIWFFRLPANGVEVQLESSSGSVPFSVESTGYADRLVADTVQQAVALVATGLGLTGPAA